MAEMILPLDLPSLVEYDPERFYHTFFWVTSPDRYDRVANANLDLLLKITAESRGDAKDLLKLKFRDLFCDFNFIAACLLDVETAKERKLKPQYTPNSFIYKQILNEKYATDAPSANRRQKSFIDKLKTTLRKHLQIYRVKSSGTTCFTNGLGDIGNAYCSKHKIEPVTVPNGAFCYSSCCTSKNNTIESLASRVLSSWKGILKESQLNITTNLEEYLNRIVLNHLLQATHDIAKPDPFDLSKMTFLSGTAGSYHNRLIGYKTRRAGGKVIRFDHGGERAFFADRWWGINEFVFCDEFVTYSIAGTKAIRENINKLYPVLIENPEEMVLSQQTSPKMQALKHTMQENKPPSSIKKIMLVPAGFSGEYNSIPSFTIHDIPYADLQITILKALEKTPCELLYKFAPKAPEGRIFPVENFGAKGVDGFFGNCLDRADLFIFTFVGTAFCEAMCTNKTIILLESHPKRPMLDKCRDELYNCCRVLKCSLNEKNRLILDSEALLELITPPSQEELESRRTFIDKWF